MIRKHFIFHGRVQGVGFRFKTYKTANTYQLTGWVRNLYNGTVEAEIQGETIHIDLLLEALQNDRYIYIDHMDVKTKEIIKDEKMFVMK